LGTMTRLIPVAASLVLLTRVSAVGVSQRWALPLTITSVVAVLYGGLTWILSRHELDGRPYWIFGMSSLSIFGVIQTQGFASQVWGLALLFSGGVLFLYSARSPRLLWLPVLGLIGFSSLPFTPSWHGILAYSSRNLIFSIPFILGLAFLILGYIRHMIRPVEIQDDLERWVWLVYPFGLAILPLTHFWVIFSIGGFSPPEGGFLSFGWWGAVLVWGTAGLFWVLHQRQPVWTQTIAQRFKSTTSLGWLYRILWWGYRNISKFISYLALLLEGQGGVLWAVLIVILLILFIFQRNGGG
ncbi:MAG: hypothetical protein MUO62_19105, partial [Anaerolineales bacterium]|nr:hypothetical protein [Anaerolineales bacterium]